MRAVSLGEVAAIVSGATPKTGQAEFWDGDIEWATPADLSRLEGPYIARTARQITDHGLRSCSATLLPVGSVLLSSRAPIGHVAINTVPMATNQGFKSLVPGPALDAKYLYHWLKSKTAFLQSLGNGATFKELSKRTTEQIQVPLPSMDEQRRIAAILDQADSIRTKRREALAHLDTLTQSIFHTMFGDPRSNPRGLPLRTLGDISLIFRDGPFGSNLKSSHYTSHGVRVIRLQNIGVGRFLDTDKAFVSEEHFASLERHRCEPGDVIIGTLGDPNLRAVVQPSELEVALNKADCIQMRVDPSVALPSWACWMLNSPGTLALASTMARGQTRTRISMGQLRSLKVPVPPLAEQQEFARRAAQLSSYVSTARRALASDDELFASLQSRAFRGEL